MFAFSHPVITGLESLEGRRMLAAASLVDGVLTIEGDAGVSEIISVVQVRPTDGSGRTFEDYRADELLTGVLILTGEAQTSTMIIEQFPGQFAAVQVRAEAGDRVVHDDQVRAEVTETSASPSPTHAVELGRLELFRPNIQLGNFRD